MKVPCTSAASSAWWLVPVFANTCCNWLRAVVGATPIARADAGRRSNFRLSAKKTLATALLTALLFVQVPSETIWGGIDLFAIVQREEVNLVGYLGASLVLATFACAQ